MKYQIPEIAFAGLKRLSEMEPEEAESVFDILENIEPEMNWESLKTRIVKTGKANAEEAVLIIDAIKGLYDILIKKETTITQLVADVLESCKEYNELEGLNLKALSERLVKALSVKKTLGITAKAENVMMEHQNVFVEARILSDLRPVFCDEIEEDVPATTVVHNLRITYLENHSFQKKVLAMDLHDLNKLEEIIARAKEKDKLLREICEKSGIRTLKEE